MLQLIHMDTLIQKRTIVIKLSRIVDVAIQLEIVSSPMNETEVVDSGHYAQLIIETVLSAQVHAKTRIMEKVANAQRASCV